MNVIKDPMEALNFLKEHPFHIIGRDLSKTTSYFDEKRKTTVTRIKYKVSEYERVDLEVKTYEDLGHLSMALYDLSRKNWRISLKTKPYTISGLFESLMYGALMLRKHRRDTGFPLLYELLVNTHILELQCEKHDNVELDRDYQDIWIFRKNIIEYMETHNPDDLLEDSEIMTLINSLPEYLFTGVSLPYYKQ